MTSESGISARALAKLLGVSHSSVNEAVAAGRIRRGADGTFDAPSAIRDWYDTRRPRAASSAPADPPGAPTMAQLHRAEATLKVEERRLRVNERKARLIDRARALLLVRRLAQEERDAILAFAPRWSAVIAARLSVDQHTLQTTLDEYLREHLNERSRPEVKL